MPWCLALLESERPLLLVYKEIPSVVHGIDPNRPVTFSPATWVECRAFMLVSMLPPPAGASDCDTMPSIAWPGCGTFSSVLGVSHPFIASPVVTVSSSSPLLCMAGARTELVRLGASDLLCPFHIAPNLPLGPKRLIGRFFCFPTCRASTQGCSKPASHSPCFQPLVRSQGMLAS